MVALKLHLDCMIRSNSFSPDQPDARPAHGHGVETLQGWVQAAAAAAACWADRVVGSRRAASPTPTGMAPTCVSVLLPARPWPRS